MSRPKSTNNPEGKRYVEASDTYNLTHLSPLKEFARGRLIHRDFSAHVFRWSHAAMLMHKNPKREEAAVLDIACGPDWPQLTVMHSNGSAPGHFVGVDLRDCSATKPILNKTKTWFQACDITKTLPAACPVEAADGTVANRPWDMIVCFEVLEHMPKESGLALLDNIRAITAPGTIVLFSTPVFDAQVGMAANHIYEWGYEELKGELESRFTLENHYGTFASLRDYTPLMNAAELQLLAKLKEYYNSAMVSCIMAPLYPQKARNVLWQLKTK